MENKIEKEKEKIKKILKNLDKDEFNKIVKLAEKELDRQKKDEYRKKRTKALIDVGAFVSQRKKEISDILKLKLLVAGVSKEGKRSSLSIDLEQPTTFSEIIDNLKEQFVNFSVYLYLFNYSDNSDKE